MLVSKVVNKAKADNNHANVDFLWKCWRFDANDELETAQSESKDQDDVEQCQASTPPPTETAMSQDEVMDSPEATFLTVEQAWNMRDKKISDVASISSSAYYMDWTAAPAPQVDRCQYIKRLIRKDDEI